MWIRFPFIKNEEKKGGMDMNLKKITDVALPEGKVYGWQPVIEGDRIIGFKNPKLGSFIHTAMVKDDGTFFYDIMLWDDGPIDSETGLATPGTITVPVRKDENGKYYVRCFQQERPVIFDHINNVQGVTCYSFPGGFASYTGESPEAVARRESLEEAGIKLIDVKIIGYSSANRANTRTCINFAVAEYVQVKETIDPSGEKIFGNYEFLIEKFPLGQDGLINEAWAHAIKHLLLG
jgi:ADP-ribose pyrophosphatase YjhB (NUDIX family)